MKIALISSIIFTAILAILKIGEAMEENNLEQGIIYYSSDGRTHSKLVKSRALNVARSYEDGGEIEVNVIGFSELSEWSVSSPEISWFGGKSMAYCKIQDEVFGFTVWDDVLYATPSIPGSIDSVRDEAQNLRSMVESQTISYQLKLPFQYRVPGYESIGVDNRLRIASIEIFDKNIIVIIENRLKSKIPVTINVPQMTLGEVGEEL